MAEHAVYVRIMSVSGVNTNGSNQSEADIQALV